MTEHQHAEAIRALADGKRLEFRVKPGATDYGSTYDWYPCDNPDFHPNFEYRIRKYEPMSEVERMNTIARMFEGDD